MPASAGWSRIAALHKSDPQKLTAAAGPTTAAVELAALHLQDAIEGRLAHGHVYIRSASLRAQRAFKVHISSAFSYTCNSVIAAHLLLSTLRPPEPHWAWLLLEALFVAVYSFDVVLKAAYMGWPAYLKKGWHRALVALVCLFAAELAERGARRALGIPGGLLAHLARPLRPAVFCVRSRLVRRLAVDCLACLRTLGRLGALLLPLLLFFATLAVRLFRGSAAHAQLGSLAAALRSLSILLTTTNLPEISDAVLGVSRAHGAFVVAFVVSGSFLLMNLALPLIYQSYCASHLKQDEKERRKAREGLGKAFSALLLPDHTALPVATVVRLLRRLDPGITRLRVAAIVQTLSPQQQPGGGTSPPQPRAASPYRRPLADPPPPAPGELVPADGVSAAAFLQLPELLTVHLRLRPFRAPSARRLALASRCAEWHLRLHLPRALRALAVAALLAVLADVDGAPLLAPIIGGGGLGLPSVDALLAAGTALEVRCSAGCCAAPRRAARPPQSRRPTLGPRSPWSGSRSWGALFPRRRRRSRGCSARCARARCARNRGGGWRARRGSSSPPSPSCSASKSLCSTRTQRSASRSTPPRRRADAVVPGKKGFGGGGEPELELNAAFSSVPIALWTCFHMLAGSKWDELIKEAANAGGSHSAGALPPRLRDAVASAYFFSFQFVAVLLVLNIICSVVAELTDHLADDDDPYAAAASEVALFDEAGVQQHIVQLWKDASSSRWRRIIAKHESVQSVASLSDAGRQGSGSQSGRASSGGSPSQPQRRSSGERSGGAAAAPPRLAGNSPQGFRSGAVAGLMLHLQRSSSQIIEAAASDVGTPRSPLSPLATTAIDEDSGSTRSPRPRTRAAAARSPRPARSPSPAAGARLRSQRPPFSP